LEANVAKEKKSPPFPVGHMKKSNRINFKWLAGWPQAFYVVLALFLAQFYLLYRVLTW
jgi:hypothetical protein